MENYKYMLSRDGNEKGTIINLNSRKCPMEGCRSFRASVRWENGKITYPCLAGTKHVDDETLQII